MDFNIVLKSHVIAFSGVEWDCYLLNVLDLVLLVDEKHRELRDGIQKKLGNKDFFAVWQKIKNLHLEGWVDSYLKMEKFRFRNTNAEVYNFNVSKILALC